MENLIVDPGGIAPVDVSPPVPAAVGFRVPEPVRMVSALPVPGLALAPVIAVRGIAQVESAPLVPFVSPPGFTDAFPVGRSGFPGGPAAVRAGMDRVYVSRLVWATPD